MSYKTTNPKSWSGRVSNNSSYFHEIVNCVDIAKLETITDKSFAIVGYACDEGVKRNHGRVGAVEGPAHIRAYLGSLANHLSDYVRLYDVGDFLCDDGSLENVQKEMSSAVCEILNKRAMPVLLGGGHDIAWAHYRGINNYLKGKNNPGKIGVINLDAHFDLRQVEKVGTSGTPFKQIANHCRDNNMEFHYLCLGVQPLSNITELYQTADALNVSYLNAEDFVYGKLHEVSGLLKDFMKKVNYVYLTIDLDGFASGVAPGVSAPSPFGFNTDIVIETLKLIVKSGKLISFDVAELNPKYDLDGRTAKLAAYLIGSLFTELDKG